MTLAPWVFIAGGVAWLALVVLVIALCRAAALGDEQAERSRPPLRLAEPPLAQVIDLSQFRDDWRHGSGAA